MFFNFASSILKTIINEYDNQYAVTKIMLLTTVTVALINYFYSEKIERWANQTEESNYYKCIFLNNKGIRQFSGKKSPSFDSNFSLIPSSQPITDFLERASNKVDLCMYMISSRNVINKLIEMRRKGVKINLIVDNRIINDSQVVDMRKKGERYTGCVMKKYFKCKKVNYNPANV